MDRIDQLLIARLRENARMPTAELARTLGLSRTTVQSRLERLERTGVVAGYTARLSEAYEGGLIHAYVMITAGGKQAAALVGAIRKMPQARRLQSVSGPFDLIAAIAAPSVAELDRLIDEIGALDGVERTTSSIVLSTKFDR